MALALCLAALLAAPSFEVASVKPGHSGATRTFIEPGGQRFTANNAPLKSLIAEAWKLDEHQILAGPSWLASEGFDIEARAAQPSNENQMRAMLRTLLEERFALRIRSAMKPLKIDTLVPTKKPATTPSPGRPRSQARHQDPRRHAPCHFNRRN